MNLQDVVAVITGGASGLGRATVTAVVEAGGRAVLVDLATSPGAEVAAALGDSVRFAPADVTDPDAVAAALDAAEDLGPIRVVVNCAGVATPGRIVNRQGPLPLADFERVIRVNLIGTFNVLRLAGARMMANAVVDEERGVIVNTASVAAYDGQIGQAAYSASKGAIVALTLPAARELASSQIRVMAIAPGIFMTPMMAGLPQQAQDSLARQIPHPSRLGDPSEYAALVRHIVENPMLNGEVIRLDGAIRMAPR